MIEWQLNDPTPLPWPSCFPKFNRRTRASHAGGLIVAVNFHTTTTTPSLAIQLQTETTSRILPPVVEFSLFLIYYGYIIIKVGSCVWRSRKSTSSTTSTTIIPSATLEHTHLNITSSQWCLYLSACLPSSHCFHLIVKKSPKTND